MGHVLKNFRQPWARPKIGFKKRPIVSLPGAIQMKIKQQQNHSSCLKDKASLNI
jgi:hypothetical protein